VCGRGRGGTSVHDEFDDGSVGRRAVGLVTVRREQCPGEPERLFLLESFAPGPPVQCAVAAPAERRPPSERDDREYEDGGADTDELPRALLVVRAKVRHDGRVCGEPRGRRPKNSRDISRRSDDPASGGYFAPHAARSGRPERHTRRQTRSRTTHRRAIDRGVPPRRPISHPRAERSASRAHIPNDVNDLQQTRNRNAELDWVIRRRRRRPAHRTRPRVARADAPHPF